MKVEVFFDVGSPYSWMAVEILLRYESLWNVEVVLVPALVGALHRETGNRPPGMLPAKGEGFNYVSAYNIQVHKKYHFLDRSPKAVRYYKTPGSRKQA